MSGRKWIKVCQGGSGYRYVREEVDIFIVREEVDTSMPVRMT